MAMPPMMVVAMMAPMMVMVMTMVVMMPRQFRGFCENRGKKQRRAKRKRRKNPDHYSLQIAAWGQSPRPMNVFYGLALGRFSGLLNRLLHHVMVHDVMMHDVMMHHDMTMVAMMHGLGSRRHFGVSSGSRRGGVVGKRESGSKHERRAKADRRKNLHH